MVHIAAQDCTIDGRYARQRCGWCGAILIDEDLAKMMTVVTDDDQDRRFPFFKTGALVRIDEGDGVTHRSVITDERLPDDCCAVMELGR